jgi:hypothetical protein
MSVMDTQQSNQDPKDPAIWRDRPESVTGSTLVDSPLSRCCENTVQLHAKHNQMMVCNECKQIIKCFKEEKPLRAYLKFCESRHRKISTSVVGVWKVVTFASYETFVR